ncbi:MAG: hypothetical protein M1817_003303 [Caeruleum heppii]|nr:MAG: hypothetical protein M1817_003303 [Caeruleum heppii]
MFEQLSTAGGQAASFHVICSPERCLKLVPAIRQRPSSLSTLEKTKVDADRQIGPIFVWEPVPDMCIPETLATCYDALKVVDVVSPNHQELAAFFGKSAITDEQGTVDRSFVEKLCQTWLSHGIGAAGQGAVVVRAGKDGCYMATRKRSRWFPAYHEPTASGGRNPKVVDPTGGGNAFLGGFTIGLIRAGEKAQQEWSNNESLELPNLEEAAIWGTVAASFAIEQVGMPSLTNVDGQEYWNDVRVCDRLAEYKSRLEGYVQPGK